MFTSLHYDVVVSSTEDAILRCSHNSDDGKHAFPAHIDELILAPGEYRVGFGVVRSLLGSLRVQVLVIHLTKLMLMCMRARFSMLSCITVADNATMSLLVVAKTRRSPSSSAFDRNRSRVTHANSKKDCQTDAARTHGLGLQAQELRSASTPAWPSYLNLPGLTTIACQATNHTRTSSRSHKMVTSMIKKTVLLLPLLVALYSSTESVRTHSLHGDSNSTTTGSLDWSEEGSGSYSADSDSDSDSGSGFLDAFQEAAPVELLSGDDFEGSGVADGWPGSASDSDLDASSSSGRSSNSSDNGDGDRVGDDEYEPLGYDYDGSDAADGWASSSSSSDTGCDHSVGESKSSGSGDDTDYDGSDVADGWSTRA